MGKLFFAVVLGFGFGVASATAEKIVVAAFEYPPIYQNGPEKGLAGDLVVAAFRAVDIDTEFHFYPVPRMVRSVADGEATCGIGGAVLFEAPDIAPLVTVSSVVHYVSQVFVYDSRKFPKGLSFKALKDVEDYRIGVLFSSGIHKFLEKNGTLRLTTNTAHDRTAKQLELGRVDVWAIVDLTGMMYMAQLFPTEASNFKYTRAFNLGDVSVVFSKKRDPNNAYNTKFKEGLAAIKKNGTYRKIMAHYYGGVGKINREALPDDLK